MCIPRLLPVALATAVILFAGCGNKPQTSRPAGEGAKPTPTTSAEYEEILRGLRNIVAKQLRLDAGDIDIDAPLSKQRVAADDLDVVEIIMKVEETFGVEIKDEEVSLPEGHLADDLTLRKLADIVERKKRVNKSSDARAVGR